MLSYVTNDLDEIEFALLYNLHRSLSPDIPYWKYEYFNLEDMEEDECKTEFRFFKKDIYDLAAILQIPEEIVCYLFIFYMDYFFEYIIHDHGVAKKFSHSHGQPGKLQQSLY